MNQKRIGILISYLNLILGMVVNIFLTPLLIVSLGDLDYSIYKVMQSLAGPLTMFHLGISTIVTRCIVKQKTVPDYTEKDKKNTIALALLSSCVMAFFVLIAGIAVYHIIPVIYEETYTQASLVTAQKVFVLFLISTVLHMLTDTFSGCMIGHEHFIASSSVLLVKTVLKLILIVIFMKCGMGVLAVVTVDLIISATIFLLSVGYALFVLHEIPRLYRFDKKQIVEICSFGFAIVLQAFVNQVNNNVDTMILGVYIDEKSIITMYSSALSVYVVYNSLISVITNYFLPKATKLVSENASGKELTDFIINPGRFQAMIAVACIFGFALFGQNFITVWIGEKYLDAYWVVLMLMIPVTIPLVENAAISILDAALKRIYRSAVLVVMAVINILISIVLVSRIGFWGVALGTVISLVVGHGILMNIYYAKVFHIEIFRMFGKIFKGILPAGLLSSLICLPLAVFLPDTVAFFLVKCGAFVLIYLLFLWLFGLNTDEKSMFYQVFKKFRHK